MNQATIILVAERLERPIRGLRDLDHLRCKLVAVSADVQKQIGQQRGSDCIVDRVAQVSHLSNRLAESVGVAAGSSSFPCAQLDEHGTPREIAAKGMLAACLQHEIDHLDGILFVDHISLIKRSIILRKLAKARRSQAASA